MIIRIHLPKAEEIAARLGIDKAGRAQAFHTNNIYRHLLPYMPMETGMFATKQTTVSSPTTITTLAPSAYYLYYGNRMVNAATGKGPAYIPGVGYRWPRGASLVATNEPLNYTKTFHPKAGPFWDQRMLADDAAEIARELKDFIISQGDPK